MKVHNVRLIGMVLKGRGRLKSYLFLSKAQRRKNCIQISNVASLREISFLDIFKTVFLDSG